jgi:hypothetical protein
MVPIGPDHSLTQRLADLGNINVCSRVLSSEEKVGDLFPEPPSQNHLHIVVQRPGTVPSSPSGEYYCSRVGVTDNISPHMHIFVLIILLVPISTQHMTYVLVACFPLLFSASRKRSRSATEEDGQAAKRREIGGNAQDIQTCCAAIHKAIKAMPDKKLSDPLTFTNLPCPSPLSMLPQRFESKEIDGINHFEYMGRSQFCELQERIKDKKFQDGAESIYLYGTSGSGKSHLLAALVYHLIREGKRVFYIPDCSTLLLDPAETMWNAYHFAYNQSPDLRTTESVETSLIRSMRKDRDVYIIVDQVNALESTKTDSCREDKVRASRWLRALRFNHRYIFSASANETSNRDAETKQRGISVFPIFGGMSPVCRYLYIVPHNTHAL